MDSNFETIIKEEFLNVEYQPVADINIPVKNEPILDEEFQFITIKKEPLSGSALQDAVTIKNENQIDNHLTAPTNNFIIYELEKPQNAEQIQNNSNQIPSETYQLTGNINNQSFNDTTSNTKPKTSGLKIRPNSRIEETPNVVVHNTSPSTSSPAPILLNTQFRKHNKGILPTSSVDKRTRYNIEGTLTKHSNTETQKASEISNAIPGSSTGCKKIINHLIQLKRNQRKQELKVNEAANRELLKPTTAQSTHRENSNTKDKPSRVMKRKLPSTSGKEHLKATNIKLKSTTKDKKFVSPSNINCIATKKLLTENISNEKSSSSKNSQETLPTPELRVKCLCRLTDNNSLTSDNSNMTAFFKEMFEKTRRLPKKQQRIVKMSLLQAISEAEDDVEQGKCCF